MKKKKTVSLARRNRLRKQLSARRITKRKVLKVGRCVKCGATENLTIDHIKPLSKGGTNSKRNLQCLCGPCNWKKGSKWKP